MGIVSSQFLGLGGINLRWELVVKVNDVFLLQVDGIHSFHLRLGNVM